MKSIRRIAYSLGFLVSFLLAGCGDNSVERNIGDNPERPLILVQVSGDLGNCEYLWNGDAAEPDQFFDLISDQLEQIVGEAGGVEFITEQHIPTARIIASPDIGFGCIAPVVNRLAYTEIGDLIFATSDGNLSENARAVTDDRLRLIDLDIGNHGDVFWDDEPISMDEVEIRTGRAAEPENLRGDEGLMINSLPIVIPSPQTKLRDVLRVLVGIREAESMRIISGCGAADQLRHPDPDVELVPPACSFSS